MCLGLFKHSKRKKRSVAEAMTNNVWIQDVNHELTAPLIAEYITLWIAVQDADFDPSSELQDEIIWTRSSSGEYTAKSSYHMQFDGG